MFGARYVTLSFRSLSANAVLRILVIGVAAGFGFVAVYMPLMTLLFDKRVGTIYFPIVAAAIWAAFSAAKAADKYLAKATQLADQSANRPDAPNMPNDVLIRRADLSSPADAEAYMAMLDMYSRDPLGDGKPLDDDVRERIIPGLLEHPTTLVWLAFDGDRPVGVVTAFRGFSSFKARPLVNIHDIAVAPEMRGKGIGKALLAAAERHARETGCCRLTLEVLEHNPAKAVYESAGYQQAAYASGAGGALFYIRPLD